MTCGVPHRAHRAGNLDVGTSGGIDLVAGSADTQDAASAWLAARLTARTGLLQAAVEAPIPFLARGTGHGAWEAFSKHGIEFLAAWALGSTKGEGGEGDEE